MGQSVEFGYNPPTFASAPIPDNPGPNERDTPFYEALQWDDVKEAILIAEELGFDAVWAPDHFMHGVDHAILEAWSLLTWTAARTDMRVGPLVTCNDYRNPALLAKMAATLDVISDGRLSLGMGAGWYEREYEAYGWEFRDGFERLMRLDESIRLMKAMWAAGSEGASFDGDHYQIKNAPCEPSPVQNPHPPIIVGGGGEEVTLKLVAKRADGWNLGGSYDVYAHKAGVIEDHCETVGREFDEIELTYDEHVLCTRDEEKLDRMLERVGPDEITSRDDIDDKHDIDVVIGTPEECAEQIERFIDLGVSRFQFWFTDYPDMDGMELFADEVIPQFR
jgi:F420-dependent oxidoreductase-like protein